MKDVTDSFNDYRECVRNLWNVYFGHVARPTQDWDIRDEFDTISRGIFSSLVLRPLDAFDSELSPTWSAEPKPLPNFRIVPTVEHGTPILINRELPRSGYWNHAVSEVFPTDVRLELLRFFDFDELGIRDYRYLEVRITASAKHLEIIGRDALIEFSHATVLYDKPEA